MQQIVLIDDDPLVRDSYARLLESDGYRTHCFASAEEFLRSVIDGKVECLIVDHRLPGVTGCDLLKLLREHRNTTPAILLSGIVDESERSLLDSVPGVRLLNKPCHADDLFNAVDTVCSTG